MGFCDAILRCDFAMRFCDPIFDAALKGEKVV
jgi:hypothetical protein